MDAKSHWEQIYRTKPATQVSWYQQHPLLSLQYIRRTDVGKSGRIVDIGGGASTLVDRLLDEGFLHITVLDISAGAIAVARQRLGLQAAAVAWLEADITQADLPYHGYDVWHDRAVFHFLTRREDRARYVDAARKAVRPGGYVIVATFAADGPTRCSGLEVSRYDPEGLHNEFGKDFKLLDSSYEQHHTPLGTEQKFIYCFCCKN